MHRLALLVCAAAVDPGLAESPPLVEAPIVRTRQPNVSVVTDSDGSYSLLGWISGGKSSAEQSKPNDVLDGRKYWQGWVGTSLF